VAATEPIGRGLGVMDAEFGDETGGLGPHDSGLWEILLSLGWFGGAAYMLSLAVIGFRLFKGNGSNNLFNTASACITLGYLSQFLLGSFMLNVSGLVLWSFAGIYLGFSNHQVDGGIDDPMSIETDRHSAGAVSA